MLKMAQKQGAIDKKLIGFEHLEQQNKQYKHCQDAQLEKENKK